MAVYIAECRNVASAVCNLRRSLNCIESSSGYFFFVVACVENESRMLAVETGLERKANGKRQRSRIGTTLARVQRVLPRTNSKSIGT